MFGLISKKKLLEEAVEIYESETPNEPCSKELFYYSMGNANALNYLCSRLGVDLSAEIRRRHSEHEG